MLANIFPLYLCLSTFEVNTFRYAVFQLRKVLSEFASNALSCPSSNEKKAGTISTHTIRRMELERKNMLQNYREKVDRSHSSKGRLREQNVSLFRHFIRRGFGNATLFVIQSIWIRFILLVHVNFRIIVLMQGIQAFKLI